MIFRIFFGKPSEALAKRDKDTTVRDLSASERIPAFVLLITLLWIGIWPRAISDPINTEVDRKFSNDFVSEEGGTP